MSTRRLAAQLSRAALAALLALAFNACASKPTEPEEEERTYDLRSRNGVSALRSTPDSSADARRAAVRVR